MQITLEAADPHAVQSYSNDQIQINSIVYSRSVIVSREEIIPDLRIKRITEMDEAYLDLLLQSKPELIIIGHTEPLMAPIEIISQLSRLQIGMESMSIGAAARTYNILLGEKRRVVAGFILGT